MSCSFFRAPTCQPSSSCLGSSSRSLAALSTCWGSTTITPSSWSWCSRSTVNALGGFCAIWAKLTPKSCISDLSSASRSMPITTGAGEAWRKRQKRNSLGIFCYLWSYSHTYCPRSLSISLPKVRFCPHFKCRFKKRT